jgi:indole-3-glycerol phosphate synthase
MQILEKIISAKRGEIRKRKAAIPFSSLEKSSYFNAPALSLEGSLGNEEGFGIIAEFKRRSPSRGIINSIAIPEDTCPGYLDAGASAVSILTDHDFFGGSNDDFLKARKTCSGVLLRKEFILDEFQVIESKSIGADAILLIADILSGNELKRLSDLAVSIGLEILFEVHDEGGIAKLPAETRLIGVNSRNLTNFKVNPEVQFKIISRLPSGTVRIAESGIGSPETIMKLKDQGFSGFLIGEQFMKDSDPAESCRKFVNELKLLKELGQH